MKTHGAYERFVRPILFSLDPETAHHLAIGLLKTGGAFPALLGPLRTFRPPDSPTSLFGLHFRNPIGLAAGFDKNAVEGARAIKFTPAIKDGEPVTTTRIVQYSFSKY